MTPEQLDTLLDIANRGAFLAPSDPSAGYDARAAAASELAAMRQPITAEALLAAGWKESSVERIWDYPSDQWDALWQIQVVTQDDGSLERVRNIDGYSINASTMYDLGELVRLLGGAA